ncbi:MAG: hypothetical protein R3C05_15605 [Pirellulaceae bacterium]
MLNPFFDVRQIAFALALVGIVTFESISTTTASDLTRWQAFPAQWKPVAISAKEATLHNSGWAYLIAPGEHANVDVSATFTINSAATQFGFFGSSWSAWPDPTYGDGGFEAGLLLRADEKCSQGYRVQVSHKYQHVALVRFPDGGYLRSVPCKVVANAPMELRASVSGNVLRVFVDGKEFIHYIDPIEPTSVAGHVGIGVSSAATVTFVEPAIVPIKTELTSIPQPHAERFTAKTWLGGRTWVFDGDEPILELHSVDDPSCFAKLKPGYKPQLTFDSHWGLENQGAFPEAASKWTAPVATGGGDSLQVTWSARNVNDRFTTHSTMLVGFDALEGRTLMTSKANLRSFPANRFIFAMALILNITRRSIRSTGSILSPAGEVVNSIIAPSRRPIQGRNMIWKPTLASVSGMGGTTAIFKWHRLSSTRSIRLGTLERWPMAKRKPSVVIRLCAAFYDTGVAFESETSTPGTKVRVKYRYTGYPADEAESLFERSTIYVAPTLDPNHHYIFADEWPTLTFSQFVPMSQTWQYGRSPFMTGHNQRPTYELAKNCGAGSGYAMKLGPNSFGKAKLSKAGPLGKGRYIVTALVKSINTLGPGGRIEVEATDAKSNKVLATAKHYIGNGTFEWRRQGFAFDLPEDATTLNVAFGNAGTGDFLITNVSFHKLNAGESLPPDVLDKANDQPPATPSSPLGAIADFRMLEGSGYHVLNHAGGDHLEIVNLDWVVDEGRAALRFADNDKGRTAFHPAGYVGMHLFGNAQDFNYLAAYRSYEGRQTVPFAMGANGGIVLGCERYYLHGAFYRGLIGRTLILNKTLTTDEVALLANDQPLTAVESPTDWKGLSIAAWIKPGMQLGRDNKHPGGGDIVGYGNRRYILKLLGTGSENNSAPYRLAARLNVNDGIQTQSLLHADHWYHVALTTALENGQRRMRLFIDGKPVADGITAKWSE